MPKKLHFLLFALLLAVGFYAGFGPAAQMKSVRAATSSSLLGWAWSDNIGWISMTSANGGSVTYGVTIPDQSTGKLSGYAWSDNIGWISFNTADVNSSSDTTKQCPDYVSGQDKCSPYIDYSTTPNWTLKGWARALSANSTSGWDGFVSLSGTAGGQAYGLKVNASTGASFIDSGTNADNAWGSNVIGWIDFQPTYGGVTISPAINTKSYAFIVPNIPSIAGTNAQILLRAKEGGADATFSGTATVTTSGSAQVSADGTVWGSQAAIAVASGQGTFQLRDTAGETVYLNIASTPAPTPAGVGIPAANSTTYSFGKVTLTGTPNPIDSLSTPVKMTWDAAPNAIFGSCEQSSDASPAISNWSNSTAAVSNSTGVNVYVPETPTKLKIACVLNADVTKKSNAEITVSVSEVPSVIMSATPPELTSTGGSSVIAWNVTSASPVTGCSVVSPAGWTPTLASPWSGSNTQNLTETKTYSIACTNSKGTGTGSVTVPVGESAESMLLTLVDDPVNDTTGGIPRLRGNLEWQGVGIDNTWSCTPNSGSTNWKSKSLSVDSNGHGSISGVLTDTRADQQFDMKCTKGSVTVYSNQVTMSENGTPKITAPKFSLITFVSDKPEKSSKVTVKLQSSAKFSHPVRFTSLGTSLKATGGATSISSNTAKFNTPGGAATNAASYKDMSYTDAVNSGSELYFALDRAVAVPSGKEYSEYTYYMKVQSTVNPALYTVVPVKLRVQNFIPNFKEN